MWQIVKRKRKISKSTTFEPNELKFNAKSIRLSEQTAQKLKPYMHLLVDTDQNKIALQKIEKQDTDSYFISKKNMFFCNEIADYAIKQGRALGEWQEDKFVIKYET